MKPRRGLVLWALLALLVVACGNDDEQPSVSGVNRGDNLPAATQAATDAPPTAGMLADLAATDDRLLVVQGDALKVYDFGTGTLQTIAEDVAIATVHVVRPLNSILYGDVNTQDIWMVDLATLASKPVFVWDSPFYNRGWRVGPVSPDQSWVAMQIGFGQYVLSADGATLLEVVNQQSFVGRWLSDTVLMLQSYNWNAGDAEFLLFDVDTQAVTPLTTTTAAMDSDPTLLEDELNGLGLSLASGRDAALDSTLLVTMPEDIRMQQSFVPCGTWGIDQWQRDGTRDTLYTIDNVYEISDVEVMPDGALVFLQGIIDECRPALPTVSLLRLDDGEPTVLADNVFAGLSMGRSSDRYFASIPTTHYVAVSDDGAFVVWIGGSLASNTVTLNLTDLRTRPYASATLLTVDGSQYSPTAFVEAGIFHAVYWLGGTD